MSVAKFENQINWKLHFQNFKTLKIINNFFLLYYRSNKMWWVLQAECTNICLSAFSATATTNESEIASVVILVGLYILHLNCRVVKLD